MAGNDPYTVLGIWRGAPLSEVKRAYRKLVFSLHSDVGDSPDETRFRVTREAYQALIEAKQQCPCRIKVEEALERYGQAGEPRGRPDPIRRRPPVNIIDDFAILRPSVGEILDRLAQKFFGFHQKSHGSLRRLGVEIVLDTREAFFGVSVPIEVPVYTRCNRCAGSGGDCGVCPSCHGYGRAGTSCPVALEIAVGARTGGRYQIDLRDAGIESLVLDVTIVVA